MPFLRAAVVLLLLVLPGPAFADDDRDDAERASRGARAGEFLPFARLARTALDRYPGKIVEAELDEDDGRVLYEIRILRPDGRVVEVELDARTGRILDVDEDD
ncbi:PepSY domain-containing protein [Aquibium microcysteis]|uniref:PepSY domain-containing protein n=1 Tax=Aquibium microcysteis TaxID=675281 RepID=UPI00165CF311|nr:PepSY domain-containing protein [Aquibium microcysteis]